MLFLYFAFIHTSIHTSINTFIHTFIHASIHTSIHACRRESIESVYRQLNEAGELLDGGEEQREEVVEEARRAFGHNVCLYSEDGRLMLDGTIGLARVAGGALQESLRGVNLTTLRSIAPGGKRARLESSWAMGHGICRCCKTLINVVKNLVGKLYTTTSCLA